MKSKRWCQVSTLNFIAFCFLAASCSTSGPAGLFGKKSAHEEYGDKIKSAGLHETALGRQWFASADKVLVAPLSVTLPYSETGYFSAEVPSAAGIIFAAKRGEKLTINLTKKPATGFAIYLDLWQPVSAGETKAKMILAGDTTSSTIIYDVNKEGNFIVRIQPELLKGGEYTLSVTTGPTLAFPVTPKVKSTVGSFWGAGRDAGTRKHEGIDIFAPRGTPLVACADGIVTRVEENQLGGKVVFMSPYDKDYSLYYAHLDQQIAVRGQKVKTGDVLGLMGNTGNASTTAPHLHFGIYTYGGAVDPLPFVNNKIKSPEKISVPLSSINKWVRNPKTVGLMEEPLKSRKTIVEIAPNTLLKVEAATAGWYKVLLPEGSKGYVPGDAVIVVQAPIKKAKLRNTQALLDEPNLQAARKSMLTVGQQVDILAEYKDFYFISIDKEKGWMKKNLL